ncbi:MAG: alpha/beta hydrolase [Candidatus Caccovivens sp.]
MKIFAWVVLAIILLIIFALMYYLVVGQILFHYVFSRKSLQDRVMKKGIDKQIKDHKIDLCWWEKYKFDKVAIESFDKLKLIGHYFENHSKKTVLVVHGFGGNYRDMQRYCQFFMQKNFNILAVENRAHGESEGNCIGFGYTDRLDILKWLDYLREKQPEAKIVLFGLSMGGTAVCATAGEKLKNVSAIISDCAFSNGDKQISYVLKKYRLFGKLLKKHLYSFTKRVYNFDVMQIDVTKSVKNSQVPILFIHGKEDTFVPIENMYDLYNATPSQLRSQFVVEGAGHALAYSEAGVMYERKIINFLKAYTSVEI